MLLFILKDFSLNGNFITYCCVIHISRAPFRSFVAPGTCLCDAMFLFRENLDLEYTKSEITYISKEPGL